jgi:signal transduction histidine kinase
MARGQRRERRARGDRRPGRPGLRGQLTASLVLTGALTLVVVAFTMLAPLERRLRADAARSLGETALASRPRLAEMPARDVFRGSPALRLAVDDIARRTHAEVAAVDAAGRVLAASQGQAHERHRDVVRAIDHDRVVARVVGSGAAAEARAAVTVRHSRPAYGLSLRRPVTGLQRARRVVVRGFLLAALAAMAAALLVGGLLPRRLVRRLNALRDAVMRREAVDPLDDGSDEVGDLARAFAAMQRQVIEQEQARRTFVATASHELRTPLASLELMLGLLEEDLAGDAPDLPDARDQVARASAQTARLRRLAGDLLDLSRLDAAVALREEPVDLGELARAVIAEFSGAGAPAVELATATSDPVWALGDPGSVAQILRILLDNALRFAPSGTDVTVSLDTRGDRVRLAVRDQGRGVAPEDHERIFERFERGSGPQESGGFGLGLAIGRELARRMGGELRLASDAAPTCFVLELAAPASEPAGAARPLAAIAQAPKR